MNYEKIKLQNIINVLWYWMLAWALPSISSSFLLLVTSWQLPKSRLAAGTREGLTQNEIFREGLYRSPEFEENGPQHFRVFFQRSSTLMFGHLLVMILIYFLSSVVNPFVRFYLENLNQNLREGLNIYLELINIGPQLDRVFLHKASIVNWATQAQPCPT